MVVVTELNVNGGKLSASFVLDESGKVVEVSNISSVHSKDATKELERLYEMGEIDFKKSLKWVEKEKVLDWLAPSSYENSGMQDNQAPFDIAKIINGFENPKVSEENQIESDKIDREYLQAVKEGDMEKAQRMVNEAAKRAGYSESSDYQGTSAFNGSAPYGNGWYLTKEERKEAWDNDEWDGDSSLGDYIDNGVDGGNIEELTNAYSYRAADPMRKEAIENVRDVVKNKKKTIMMYRSVPSSVKEGHFRNGDWVTPSKKYAIDNARIHGWENDYRTIEQEVPVDDVWFDGNDIAEWGYGRAEDVANEKDFGYKNTKNNRKLLDPVTYDDNGNVIPLSERFNEGSGDIRFRDEVDGFVSSSVVDGLRERAVELGRELGADVDVVSDVSEITDPNPEVQERKRRAKGWYDAKTGRVVINLAAHSDMADVEQTLLHEVVGHRGLRGLVGHENFNGFLDGIYEHASDGVREGIDDIARRKGCSRRVATEEYMSGLAEGGFADRKNAGLWQQIRQWFSDMLSRAKIKLNFSISDNELRYLLWRSHELSRMNGREGVVGRARDLAMQNRLGVGNGVDLFRTSKQLDAEYGSRWIDEQTNADGRHTTQVKNTVNSYKKFGEWVQQQANGKKVDVLDASSGLGVGTEWLREHGMNVDDVEPYPSANRTAPTYSSYEDIDKRYDYIISNAVLNVIPEDWRADVLHSMADKLKVGGKLVINVRGAESIRNQGTEGQTRITLDDASEILVLRPNGTIKAYQKGFTKAELKGWCEKELGDGYSVEVANSKNGSVEKYWGRFFVS